MMRVLLTPKRWTFLLLILIYCLPLATLRAQERVNASEIPFMGYGALIVSDKSFAPDHLQPFGYVAHEPGLDYPHWRSYSSKKFGKLNGSMGESPSFISIASSVARMTPLGSQPAFFVYPIFSLAKEDLLKPFLAITYRRDIGRHEIYYYSGPNKKVEKVYAGATLENAFKVATLLVNQFEHNPDVKALMNSIQEDMDKSFPYEVLKNAAWKLRTYEALVNLRYLLTYFKAKRKNERGLQQYSESDAEKLVKKIVLALDSEGFSVDPNYEITTALTYEQQKASFLYTRWLKAEALLALRAFIWKELYDIARQANLDRELEARALTDPHTGGGISNEKEAAQFRKKLAGHGSKMIPFLSTQSVSTHFWVLVNVGQFIESEAENRLADAAFDLVTHPGSDVLNDQNQRNAKINEFRPSISLLPDELKHVAQGMIDEKFLAHNMLGVLENAMARRGGYNFPAAALISELFLLLLFSSGLYFLYPFPYRLHDFSNRAFHPKMNGPLGIPTVGFKG